MTRFEQLAAEGREYLSALDIERTGLVSRASVVRWSKEGKFPLPVKFGDRRHRWRVSDIIAWERAQPREAPTP